MEGNHPGSVGLDDACQEGRARAASPGGDKRQSREALLASAEAHRDAAQIALFAGDEAAMLAHVKAAVADEEAAKATTGAG